MLIGLQKQWQILRTAAEKDKLPHAFLFSGPDKVGKKTLALNLVKFIFCQGEKEMEGFSCGKCRACIDVGKKAHPDLALIEPKDGSIKISQIRDLEWKLSLKPYSAKMKAGIIDDAHLMLPDAQNSLLKTLEEPRGKALLILISSDPQRLLKTVFSRVRTMKFFLAPDAEIKEKLASFESDFEKIEKITNLSLGRPGQAMEFLNDHEKFLAREKKLEEIEKIMKAKIPEKFKYAKEIADSPEIIEETLALWERRIREELILCKESSSCLVRPLRELEEALRLVKTTNASPKLILENLMLNFNI